MRELTTLEIKQATGGISSGVIAGAVSASASGFIIMSVLEIPLAQLMLVFPIIIAPLMGALIGYTVESMS